ncbi:MAG: Asp/Glu racemase, partial [Elsteraceae bacterium]
MPVIACLHTADSNVAVFDAALAQLDLGAHVILRHAVRADLLLDSEAAGGMTPEISARAGDARLALAHGAAVVMLTSSPNGRAGGGGGAR